VRRTSVTEVAQSARCDNYVRGQIKIVDPEKLKAISCERYETVRDYK